TWEYTVGFSNRNDVDPMLHFGLDFQPEETTFLDARDFDILFTKPLQGKHISDTQHSDSLPAASSIAYEVADILIGLDNFDKRFELPNCDKRSNENKQELENLTTYTLDGIRNLWAIWLDQKRSERYLEDFFAFL